MLNTIPRKGQRPSIISKRMRGTKPLMYARQGFVWVRQPDGSSQYMPDPEKPGATGITIIHHGMPRRERRWWEKTRKGQRKLRYLQSLED
jgi:hypothetical protein